MVDDCVITTGGVDIVTKDRFKAWVKQFLDKVADLEFGVVEIFQNEDGSRVRRGNCRPCNRTFFADWFEKRALDIFSKTTDHCFFVFPRTCANYSREE